MTTTFISNEFRMYFRTIRTKGMPAVTTIKKHLRASKVAGCESITEIIINRRRYDLVDLGHGPELCAI